MQKSNLLRAIQQEILQHDFSYFVDEPPSIAQGGRGVIVPGCPACMKRINTMACFVNVKGCPLLRTERLHAWERRAG